MKIEMFSLTEQKMFIFVFCGFILTVVLLYFITEAVSRYAEAKVNERELKRLESVRRRYEVDINEFERIGEIALREQKMKSFICETSTDRLVEFKLDDILEEVKERKNVDTIG